MMGGEMDGDGWRWGEGGDMGGYGGMGMDGGEGGNRVSFAMSAIVWLSLCSPHSTSDP